LYHFFDSEKQKRVRKAHYGTLEQFTLT